MSKTGTILGMNRISGMDSILPVSNTDRIGVSGNKRRKPNPGDLFKTDEWTDFRAGSSVTDWPLNYTKKGVT